ncbi:MAG: GNAT family N-acetyltransferase [Acidimicrobiia bacterium]|nr:GNAT family N-acetyltransferase [Acidimicrobiia bacterium]
MGYDLTDDEVEQRIVDVVGRPDHLALVVEFGVTVGWVHAYEVSLLEEPLTVEIGGLVVSDTARRRGTGTLLMGATERWALNRGIPRIRMRTNAKRKAAHRFYRALGYREVKKSLTFAKQLEIDPTVND